MKVQIRFSHNEIGMLIEARLPKEVDSNDWQVVEMQKYTAFKTRAYGWGQISHVMSVDRQERAYLDFLDDKGVLYEVIRHGVKCAA